MPTLRESLSYQPAQLAFGTSGLRAPVTDMTDLECYINTAGFLRFLVAEKQLRKGDVVLLAGDLRDSTPRILQALHQAITDNGFATQFHGFVPTPAIAYEALERHAPCITVTGSHIPADRNGIKFYKADGEVLKDDELPIKQYVDAVRAELYGQDVSLSAFNKKVQLHKLPTLPEEDPKAAQSYTTRYTSVFGAHCLAGKKIVFYQHSAVGRDLLVDIFEKLGAEVVTVGRSEVFVPIDSENVTPEYLAYFRELAGKYPDAFAITSTDGDSDRPFVVDETGTFHRGDVLGAVAARWLKADAAAYPVSASDAADDYLAAHGVPLIHTKIGSPFVIVAMQEAAAAGSHNPVGWEVNGGLLHSSPIAVAHGILKPLPTRDAFLPILAALLAANERNISVSALFKELPERFTGAGLIDDFPIEIYRRFVDRYGSDTAEARKRLGAFFTAQDGFGAISKIDSLDGVRIYFDNGEIAHLRESSNAPQLRIYAITGSAARSHDVVALAIAKNGIFRKMEAANQN